MGENEWDASQYQDMIMKKRPHPVEQKIHFLIVCNEKQCVHNNTKLLYFPLSLLLCIYHIADQIFDF